jgi:glycosyltransferase involved in cell wall biosynthesis
VIAIENISFDRDTRARLFARSLREAGFEVSVVCPRSAHARSRRALDGVRVRSFPTLPFDTLGFVGHALEYLWCCSAIGTMLVWLRLRGKLGIAHLCTPPHFLFVVARLLRVLGCRIVIDQHDLMPELFAARYGPERRLTYRIVLAAERRALRAADVVLTCNGSSARAAIERAGAPPARVRVVRTGLPREHVEALASLRRRRAADGAVRVGYVGNIERQDGVEHLVRAMRHLVVELGWDGVRLVCIGGGNDLPRLRSVARALGVAEVIEFTGQLPRDAALRRLADCDICVQPDPSSDFNETATMIKSLEYMALAKPVVAFDLHETRVSCGPAALYADPDSAAELAAKIAELARNPVLRHLLGESGLDRVSGSLAWEASEGAFLRAYRRLAGAGADGSSREHVEAAPVEPVRHG